MITQTYKLNMIPFGVLPLVNVSQYDNGARTIVFNLYNGEEEYTPTDVTITLGDKTVNGTIDGSSVSFVVTHDLTQESGIFLGEITDSNNNGIISSCNFKFRVDSTPYDGSTPQDEDVSELNSALSILLDRNINIKNPQVALDIIKGE